MLFVSVTTAQMLSSLSMRNVWTSPLSSRPNSLMIEKRLTARLVSGHPGAQVVVGVHLEVGLELVAELAVAPLPAPKTTQPPHPGPQRSHDCSSADEAAPG
jgi:hypothetical protein